LQDAKRTLKKRKQKQESSEKYKDHFSMNVK